MLNANDTTSSDLLTVADVARKCKTSTRTVRRWIANGELTIHRLGGQIRITPADFDTFIKLRRSV